MKTQYFFNIKYDQIPLINKTLNKPHNTNKKL